MASNASFDAVLKRYMPYELLQERMAKLNYFWNKCPKKQGWKGGTLEVPFEGAGASSLSMGALTAADDIAENVEVMGTLSSQPELWGTMKFNEKDLDRHSGDMEASYLELAPGKIKEFTEFMSQRVSLMTLGGHIAALTADGGNGSIVVDKPNRFRIGEKITVDDDNSNPVSGYITAIDRNTKTLTVKDARSGGAAVNLSDYTVAQGAKAYVVGSNTAGFTSLRSQLLSLANGGSTNIAGTAKTAYPFLQALNHDGSSADANTLLECIFDSYYDHLDVGAGNPTEAIMSMSRFADVAKVLEVKRNFVVSDKKGGYGFRSITLSSNEGDLTLTGLRDMADDIIPIVDWEALKFHGDKWFERKRHDGKEYFLARATTGYEYIVDVKFYGDLLVHNPSHCSIIHGIDY